jgi:osmoprotectant transport system permease protein
MSLWSYLVANGPEVGALTLEHLWLVGISIGLAILIGVPLGILLTRRPALSGPILGGASIAQTIPSLALFGFLIPLNVTLFHWRLVGGIGQNTAIAVLVLYALLPIIRNTYTGIVKVDPAAREAGRAMGMTNRQLLLQVELPLALEIIIAGIRVATVITVGTATIAAAIDAGGLGRYIFRGLRMNDNTLIMVGALMAALIALAADLGLGGFERLFSPGRMARKGTKWGIVGAIALLVGGSWAAYALTSGQAAKTIVVGSKDFTEQVILGEIVAQEIEATTKLPVRRRFDLGGNLAHEALVSGEIDTYVEYTGTALTALLKERPIKDPEEVYQLVKKDYAERFHVDVTTPLGFNNTFAILVRGDEARSKHLKTISQAARYAPSWQAGFGQDFMSRPDGYPGFSAAYGLKFAARPREMDLALTYRALKDGQVDLIAGNSTDGLISRFGLVQLEDDRHYFPPYDAVPVLRHAVAARHPEVRKALERLGGRISVDDMRGMNLAVDGEHRDPKDVAKEFLKRKGLI